MINCPDCGHAWHIDCWPACGHCGLTREDLDDAAAHLAQLDAERHDERREVELVDETADLERAVGFEEWQR